MKLKTIINQLSSDTNVIVGYYDKAGDYANILGNCKASKWLSALCFISYDFDVDTVYYAHQANYNTVEIYLTVADNKGFINSAQELRFRANVDDIFDKFDKEEV